MAAAALRAIDCDCSRSSVAATGSASASVGTTKLAGPPMPETGSQPVRAAIVMSTSDPMSGGTDSSTSDAPRMQARQQSAAAAAGHDAGGNAHQRRDDERAEREKRGVRRALAHQRP